MQICSNFFPWWPKSTLVTLLLKQVKTALSGSTPQFSHLPYYYPYWTLEFTCNFKEHKQREAEEPTAENRQQGDPRRYFRASGRMPTAVSRGVTNLSFRLRANSESLGLTEHQGDVSCIFCTRLFKKQQQTTKANCNKKPPTLLFLFLFLFSCFTSIAFYINRSQIPPESIRFFCMGMDSLLKIINSGSERTPL